MGSSVVIKEIRNASQLGTRLLSMATMRSKCPDCDAASTTSTPSHMFYVACLVAETFYCVNNWLRHSTVIYKQKPDHCLVNIADQAR